MAKKLVIVESPTKAKTIGQYLGREYKVVASIGHIRDLPKSRLGVDIERDFEPKYLVPKEKRTIVRQLKEAVAEAPEIFLATDPDREGEAISWHIIEATQADPGKVRRVVFHEITPKAIAEAFQSPRPIDSRLVEAQQARRILDRLVGYMVSPLLWRKIQHRLSAGRVQSVALRLVVEREREIQAFVPEEYWTVEAVVSPADRPERRFRAVLWGVAGEKEKLNIKTGDEAAALVAALKSGRWAVGEVRKRTVQRDPAPPFTTSTLQQEASRKLRFTAKRTMLIAQQLYEGVELGPEGQVGLITYMRTDSTAVSDLARAEARDYITRRFGADFAPPAPRYSQKKAKGAQEAHEAIRPTSVFREPASIRQYLTPDQYKLYDLIWKRFVASQMESATVEQTSVDILVDQTADGRVYLLRATGSVIQFPGFLEVYIEGKDDEDEAEEGQLPPLRAGEALNPVEVTPKQHFTQPPPRYTEASLVKTLEELGIGRPSTYAPILATIQERGYVRREDRRLIPTELGMVVNDLLVSQFPEIFNVDFTARMEEELDEIARGETSRVEVLRDFYIPFQQALEAAERLAKIELGKELLDEKCPECGRPLMTRTGKYGQFIGCTGFPECRYTRPVAVSTGARCPQCGGELVERRARRTGRVFYGCINYPACNFTVWERPLPEPCPRCGGLLVAGKNGRRCTTEGCGYVAAEEEVVEVLG